jgi:molecular chaperone HtpG
VECGLFAGEEMGRIDVTLDPGARSVVIRDDAIGVRADDAERVLTSIGASSKRGTTARGFRGVGRLAAFGYAQEVTFRAKASGDRLSRKSDGIVESLKPL